MTPKFIIIHHTAVSRKHNPQQFNAIDRYHKSLGWGKIGYHYLIEPDGKLKKGREENEFGAHCRAFNMNYKSIGIALAGNFEIEHPTAEQLHTLKELILKLKKKYVIPNRKIVGHKDAGGLNSVPTACPGRYLLPFIRGDFWEKEVKREKTKEEKLKEQIEDLRNAVKLWQEKYQTEKKKREQIERELKDWKERHSILVAEKRMLKARAESFEKEVKRLNELLRQEKQEKTDIIEQAKKLKSEILLLQEKYKKDTDALMRKIQELTAENVKLKARKPCTLANCFAFMVEYLLKVVKFKKNK